MGKQLNSHNLKFCEMDLCGYLNSIEELVIKSVRSDEPSLISNTPEGPELYEISLIR